MHNKKRSAATLVTHNNKLLLQLRDDLSWVAAPNTWGLPGGGVEKGESFTEGMRRELMEEICMIPDNLRLLGKINLATEITALYIAVLDDSEVEKVKFGGEGQEIRFVEFEKIHELELSPYLKEGFREWGKYVLGCITNGTEIDTKKLGLL